MALASEAASAAASLTAAAVSAASNGYLGRSLTAVAGTQQPQGYYK